MEEYDPYAQHNEVPAIGYIDPPAEPYRYISPLKREIKPKTVVPAGTPREHNGSTSDAPAKGFSSPKETNLCDRCKGCVDSVVPSGGRPRASISASTQTVLTMADIDKMAQQPSDNALQPVTSISRASSAGGTAKRVSSALMPRRPPEPLRSSSSKKIPAAMVTTVPVAAQRSKSNSKVAEVVVAAPRSSRVSAPAGSPSTKPLTSESHGTPTTPTSTSMQMANTRGGGAQQQRLLDVTPAVVRKMFSGSGNNGVGSSARTHSANKMGSVSASPSSASLAPTAAGALKRAKSSDRQGPTLNMIGISGGSAGAALQAALSRSLVRKQATAAAPKGEQVIRLVANKPSGDAGASTGDASPNKKVTGVSVLSASPGLSISRPGGAARAPSSSPSGSALNTLNTPPPPAKFSRGPSTGSQGAPTTLTVNAAVSQRRPLGTSAGAVVSQSPTSVTAAKRANAVGNAACPPTRTVSSKVVARKSSSDLSSPATPSHVDPMAYSSGLAASPTVEIKKAQGMNHQIVHAQASLDDRERAREWQQKADEKAT